MRFLARVASIVAVGIALLFGIACKKALRQTPNPGEAAASPRIFPAEIRYDIPTPDIGGLPLDRTREVLAVHRVVRPDRRFIGALVELHAMLARKPPKLLVVSWSSDHWQLALDGVSLGSFSSVASFGETLNLLKDRASALLPATTKSGAAGGTGKSLSIETWDLFSDAPMKTLKEAEQQWQKGRRDSRIADNAGHALVCLALQNVDRLGLSDPLYARALALLAIRGAFLGKSADEDAAILASLMGYRAEALDIASRLPSDSPVRFYVEGEESELRRVAELPNASSSARYLYLLRFPSEAKMQDWSEWVEKSCPTIPPGLPLFRTAMEVHDFGPDRESAEILLHAVTAEVGGSGAEAFWRAWLEQIIASSKTQPLADLLSRFVGSGPERSRRILQRFEAALESKVPRSGVLAGGEAERCWYRSIFYSALFEIGRFQLDRRSSGPDALAFAAFLDDVPAGPAADFRRWFTDLARFRSDERSRQALIEDLRGLPHLGYPAIHRVAEEILPTLSLKSQLKTDLYRLYQSRLDGRNEDRLEMANVCWMAWSDLKCYEDWRRDWADLQFGKGPAEDPGYAAFFADKEALSRIVDNKRLDARTRDAALWYLGKNGWLEEEEIVRRYRKLYAEFGSKVFNSYVTYLEDHGRLKEAEAVARQELAADSDASLLTQAYDAQRLAGLLEKQGRHDEAWRTIEPWVDTWKSDVMGTAAIILESLGRHEEALKLARRNLDRYPDGHSVRSDLARILWLQGKYAEVPLVFLDPQHRPTPTDWRDGIAPKFASVFRNRPPGEAKRAFEAFFEHSYNPWLLLEFSKALAEVKRFDSAFEVASSLSERRLSFASSPIYPSLDAYRYLRELRGENAAAAWVLENMVPAEQETIAGAAFRQRELGLFRKLVPEGTQRKEEFWVLLAAAVALEPGKVSDLKPEIDEYFGQEPSKPSRVLGRYLLGGIDSSDVFRMAASSPNDRGRAAYVLGLRAIAQGRYEEASDWLLVCREVDGNRTGAGQASLFIILKWQEQQRPLRMLAQMRVF